MVSLRVCGGRAPGVFVGDTRKHLISAWRAAACVLTDGWARAVALVVEWSLERKAFANVHLVPPEFGFVMF